MAESADFHATVMPFILRGVSLLGASSNNTPMALRHELWQRLAGPWRPKHLERVVARTIGLKDLTLAFEDLLHRRVQGRILVEIRSKEA
jgi:NADPH2:quinone reductase